MLTCYMIPENNNETAAEFDDRMNLFELTALNDSRIVSIRRTTVLLPYFATSKNCVRLKPLWNDIVVIWYTPSDYDVLTPYASIRRVLAQQVELFVNSTRSDEYDAVQQQYAPIELTDLAETVSYNGNPDVAYSAAPKSLTKLEWIMFGFWFFVYSLSL